MRLAWPQLKKKVTPLTWQRTWPSSPSATGEVVLPGKIQKPSGVSGPGALLGAVGSLNSLTAFRGTGLMGQNLPGAQLSPPKSMLSDVGKFISTLPNIGKGLLRRKSGPDMERWGLNSPCLQRASSSSHTHQVPSSEQGIQCLTSSSLKHWGRSVSVDDKTEVRE